MKIKIAAIALLTSASMLTACGSGDSQWCEFDSTDQVVNDSFCQAGTPGYEWEHGSDSSKRKKIKKSSKIKGSTAKSPAYKAPVKKRTVVTTPRKAPSRNK